MAARSLVPVIMSASGIFPAISGSAWGIHPVRTMTESGAVLRIFLTAYRDLLSPEPVTVQELIRITSAPSGASHSRKPFSAKALRRHSVSYWLTLQPKVIK